MATATAERPTLDDTFAALADPTRRAILERLMEGEASVAELTAPFDMSQPAISKHLKYLERAGLVSRHREAQRRMCRLEAAPMAEAVAWLEGYRKHWEANYARLDALLERMKAAEAAAGAEAPGSADGEDRAPSPQAEADVSTWTIDAPRPGTPSEAADGRTTSQEK